MGVDSDIFFATFFALFTNCLFFARFGTFDEWQWGWILITADSQVTHQNASQHGTTFIISLMYTILLHIMIYSHFLSKTTLNLILEATHAIILKFDQ